MHVQEAVRILMMSPFYFKMDLANRKALVEEFCLLYDGALPASLPMSPLPGATNYSKQKRVGGGAIVGCVCLCPQR